MRTLWLIPVALVALAASAFLSRARRHKDITLSNEPVSSDWLAQARAKDDHPW
jgi:hypothetical protein